MELDYKFDEISKCTKSYDDIYNRITGIYQDFNSIKRKMIPWMVFLGGVTKDLNEVSGRINDHKRTVSSMQDTLKNASVLYTNSERRVMSESQRISSGDYMEKSGNELLQVSVEEKTRCISEFEKEHPDTAKKFNNFLNSGKNNKLTEEDIRNIKYLTYNAEEPYRSIYLKSLSRFKVDNGDLDGGAYYKPFLHTLNYSYPECFADDPRGPYTTVFHECGHAIDDLSEESKWWGADTENFKTYSDSMGREVTLYEAIEYDVYYNADNPHSMTSIGKEIIGSGTLGSKGNLDTVIKAIRSGSNKSLGKDDTLLYNAIISQHNRTTGNSAAFEAVTDVYGGMSHNQLRNNGYGHAENYWNNKTSAPSELWAEFYSYNMAGDRENLSNLKDYFPTASKFCESYAYALVED